MLLESGHEVELKGCLYFEHLKKGEMNFLIDDILKFFIFPCALIVFEAKNITLWLEHTIGNKIDGLENMMWPQFPTEVLQIMTGIG